MPDQNQASSNEALFAKLAETLSADRIGRYLTATGYDKQRALALYVWNAKIGEAFHVPIQAVEVGLRNRITVSLADLYGSEWWRHIDFKIAIDEDREADLETVFRRIRNRGLSLDVGQIVAGLSFGFWVALLQPRYNPKIWSSHLRVSFPDLPQDKTRNALAKRAGEVAFIRNRISHHEPVFRRDLSKDFQQLLEFLSWICPTKAGWIKPHCRVQEVLRQKP